MQYPMTRSPPLVAPRIVLDRAAIMDQEIRDLVSKYGFATLVGALARYACRPDEQQLSVRVFGTAFRRLNAVYEYLKNNEGRS
jgi:hypothetical protein